MPKRKPTTTKKARKAEKARGVEIDWLIGRVLQSTPDLVLKAVRVARETEERRQRTCALFVDGGDPIAQTFYEHCHRAGMTGPPQLKPTVVTTLLVPFEPLMANAAVHYATAEHVEAPLGAGEVRAVVLTLGTLTVVRLGPDGIPRHASRSRGPLRPDVLLAAVACWRNDRPEGFHLQALFHTKQQGERFSAQYNAELAEIEASSPTQYGIEEQLSRFKPAYGDSEPPFEVQARVYAEVGWLERARLLPDDRFNGLEFTYGCEMDLQNAGELVRMLGGPRDDLS